eukprot:1173986-Rhodomonas_salina.5
MPFPRRSQWRFQTGSHGRGQGGVGRAGERWRGRERGERRRWPEAKSPHASTGTVTALFTNNRSCTPPQKKLLGGVGKRGVGNSCVGKRALKKGGTGKGGLKALSKMEGVEIVL